MTNATAPSFFRRYHWALLFVAVVVAIGLEIEFRPELLFINKTVHEDAPAGIVDAQPLFTGALTSFAGEPEVHGRFNVIQQASGLQLQLTGFSSKAPGPFIIALAGAEGDDAGKAKKLGDLTAGLDHVTLALPAGTDPAKEKTVLLTGAGQQHALAKATLEAF